LTRLTLTAKVCAQVAFTCLSPLLSGHYVRILLFYAGEAMAYRPDAGF